MDITKENIKPNPRDRANPLSVLFFTYTIDFFKKGYKKALNVDDLYKPFSKDRSTILGDRLEKTWNKHMEASKKKQRKPSLLKVLIATFWPEYLVLGINLVCMDIFVLISQPLILRKLLDYFRPDPLISKTEALWYAGGIVCLNFLSAFFLNHYLMDGFHCGMKVRAACCALIYRKALKLSRTSLGEIVSGKVVNLLSNDVSRFDYVSILIHHMWVAPTASLIVTYLLYVEAGYAGVVGIVPVLFIVPLQGYTGKLAALYRKKTASRTDERVRLMDEIISGVQVIKMYAWEKPFEKLIKLTRKSEMRIVLKSAYMRGLYMTFNLFIPRIALFSALVTMAMTEQEISATKVFVLVAYFNVLSQTIGSMFVRGMSEVAELFVTIKRLEDFMMNHEFESIENIHHSRSNNLNTNAISLRQLTVKWNATTDEIALDNVDLNVESGALIGIIGQVGSGKSSLLQSILGELKIVGGEIDINGSLSYASQEPWVFATTIRQNILFGEQYDRKRYNDVIRACALEKDFEQFSDGDQSIVGERGASLSGGQKARISLARAVYRNADIYLLDDPLSAVDIHVSKHLYNVCINGYLARKTRILVTHQVQQLKNADHIIILKNGKIEKAGKFADLSASDSLYAQLLTAEPEPDTDRLTPLENGRVSRKMSLLSSKSSINSAVSDLSISGTITKDNENEIANMKLKDMEEKFSEDKMYGSLFWKYLTSAKNLCFVASVLFLYILTQIMASGVDYFVIFWIKIEESRYAVNSTNLAQLSRETCLYIYTGEIVLLFVSGILRSIFFYKLSARCSQKLHDAMFSSVVGTNMRFFDTNPSGRILNRFSKDMGSVDELLPKAILDAGQILLLMTGALVLVALVNQQFLILLGIVLVFFLILRHIYLKSSKNIKRLEGIMRSPVFTHLNVTIQGLTTIRAFGVQDILKKEFDKHQDHHSSVWFMFIAISSAFGFYLDLLCSILVAFITFSFLTFGESLGYHAGEVGLAITQASTLLFFCQWGLRQSAEVVNQLMSVERILEYTNLPKETQPAIPKHPPKEWPQRGQITLNKMGLKYVESGPESLQNLNVTIEPHAKVGIVGRTGAGKSSLISALFRLAIVEGKVDIDGIDTKDLDLKDLRSRISIIPQDPVLFSGTLRYNLDPFEEYNDDILYRAISDVELKDPANMINRLENRVMDRGSNYSVGQRQLICLARAIIRKNKILLLDEATANVDPQTDALIQKTIRNKFAECTVLTVAHRLNTIMDSDKILVMDSGTMVEFDHPHVLLQNKTSTFYQMVAESSKTMAEQFRRIAKDSYQSQLSVPE